MNKTIKTYCNFSMILLGILTINCKSILTFNPKKSYHNAMLACHPGIREPLSHVNKNIHNPLTIKLIHFLKQKFLYVDQKERERDTGEKNNIDFDTIDFNNYISHIACYGLTINNVYDEFFYKHCKSHYINDVEKQILLKDSILEILNNKDLSNKLQLVFKDEFSEKNFVCIGIDTVEEYNYFKNIVYNKNKIDCRKQSSEELFFILFILLSVI